MADHPAVPDYAWELGAGRGNLGIVLRALGEHNGGEQSYRQGIAVYRNLVARFPDVPDYRRQLALSEKNLGNVLGDNLGRPREAEEAYRRAIAVQKRLVADFPRIPFYQEDLAHSYFCLAKVLHHSGRYCAEEEALSQALKIQEKLLAAVPGNPAYRSAVAQTSNCLARLLVWAQGPPFPGAARAVALAKHAVRLNPEQGISWFTFGVAHYRAGNWKESLEAMERSLKLRFTHPSGGWFFAMVYWQLGNKEKAEKCYRDAERWMEKNSPKDKGLLRFRAEAAALLGIHDQRPKDKEEAPRKD